MKWKLEFHAAVESDMAEAAEWYDHLEPGLGAEFTEDVIREWDKLTANPFLRSKRHPKKNVRWRLAERFPYRIIYEIVEAERLVIVSAVIHAARHDRHWHERL